MDIKLSSLIKQLQVEVYNPQDKNLDTLITNLSPLHQATNNHLSFYKDPKYYKQLLESKAYAILCKEKLPSVQTIQLICRNPAVAFADASSIFYNREHRFQGHSPHAFIHPSTQIGSTATIFPHAYIEANCKIGEHSVIYPNAHLAANVQIGDNVIIYPGVVILENTTIGDNCLLHPNSVIGADGFGFATDKTGQHKIEQQGKVKIEDNVEVGPLCTIDRATFDNTTIKKGSKLDAQVHLGHNVQVGQHSMLCAQVGIAGSSKLGDFVIAAGQAGIANNLEIADNVILGGQAGVTASLESGEYMGTPAIPFQSWRRQVVYEKALPALNKRVKQLEIELNELKSQLLSKPRSRPFAQDNASMNQVE